MRIDLERRLPLVFGILTLIGGLTALTLSTQHHLGIAGESTVAPSIIQSLLDGFGQLWLQLIGFLLAFALLHFLDGWIFGHAGLFIGQHLGEFRRLHIAISIVGLVLFVVWVMLQNSIEFRHSLFAWQAVIMQIPGISIVGTVLGWILAFYLTVACIFWLKTLLASRAHKSLLALLTVVVLALTASYVSSRAGSTLSLNPDPDRPHIILIGIDSWRLDTLPSHGGDPSVMPNVESILEHAVIVEQGLTSLARSYPSWWSVFSGQYPQHHGARFNLIPRDQVRSPPHLTQSLGELGYHRIFAMDERRFANIGLEHGFDKIVGPQTGAADFLLGTIADTPLSNLVINTALGAWIFPHLNGNRAAYVTYHPETFSHNLENAIRGIPDQPLFLAVHHELPHWPYHWSRGPTGSFLEPGKDRDYSDYLETLHHADAQLGTLLDILDERGILNHSLMILIADHGEAFVSDLSSYHDVRLTFGWPDPQLPYRRPTNTQEPTSLHSYPGHGTHILSLKQHEIPIILRDFTREPEPGRVLPGRATLADIYPTIMDRLNHPVEADLDGLSLLPFIQNETRLPA